MTAIFARKCTVCKKTKSRKNGTKRKLLSTFPPPPDHDRYADVTSGRVTFRQPTDSIQKVDCLNGDCWRLILDYVPLKNIIRSERVSRRWQGVVHRYLEEVGICVAKEFRRPFAHRDVKRHPKNRIIEVIYAHHDCFRRLEEQQECQDLHRNLCIGALREKWGAYTVYTFCSNGSELDHIMMCCPNLKGLAIEMRGFQISPLSQSQLKFCEKLEQLVLIDLTHYDDYKNHLNGDTASISNLKPTKLKSLTVCGAFDFCHFLADIPCFPELTKLTVQGHSSNIPVLFEKTKKLERLVVMESHIDVESCKPKTFSHLKYLTLCSLKSFEWMGSLSNCDMQTLNFHIGSPELKRVAIKLMQTQWPSLTKITMDSSYGVTDDEVCAMIAACPVLKTLDVAGGRLLSSELVQKAARAAKGRNVPLLLKIAKTRVEGDSRLAQTQYPELILDTKSGPNPPPEHVTVRYE